MKISWSAKPWSRIPKATAGTCRVVKCTRTKLCTIQYTSNLSWSRPAHVQGVRLNHALFFGRRTQLCSETALGYDVVERRLRQEVQHGHCSAADLSRGTFALNPGGVTAPGGRHAH